jgi:23S rRNA (adenine2503-C2)-methyltransferase
MTPTQIHFYDLSRTDLEALIASWKLPAFRARQLLHNSYVNLIDNPAAMTDVPQALRSKLATELTWHTLQLIKVQTDDDGLTRKALFQLPDGEVIESVLMIYDDRATVCVSTQAGCAMGCVFCATGRLGLLKNLSAGQIVEQVLWAARELHSVGSQARYRGQARFERLSNIVFMGMGEPFANYDRWWRSVEQLHEPLGYNLGARGMTVSTVGLPQGIRRLAHEALPINLAISLHAPNDQLRSEMMPVNQRFPLAELMAATREYVAATNRRVSFEYVLLQQRNDTPELAQELAGLIRGQAQTGAHVGLPMQLTHVNLIPWNPIPGTPLGRSEYQRVLEFQRILHQHGIGCTVRVERGVAIAAACGQLAGSNVISLSSNL